MCKKFISYLFLFTMLIMIGDYGIDYTIAKQIDNKSPYYLSFASIGANSLESRMDCWATIRMEVSADKLKNNLSQILYCLNLPADESKYIFLTDKNSISLNYQTHNEHLKGYFCLEVDQQKHETYIVISLATDDNNLRLSDFEENLNRFPGVKWKYYYLYTASLDYIVASESHKELLKVINKKFNIQNTEIYLGENVTSMAGFSSLIKTQGQKSAINNKTYNVQVAVRNNTDDRKTYIYIGSPLILGDY